MTREKLEAKLSESSLIGSWVQMDSLDSAEILARLNYDFIVLDFEHSHIGLNRVRDFVSRVVRYDSSPWVRIPNTDSVLANLLLDLGVEGLVIANVENPNQLKTFLDEISWFPIGTRGVSLNIENDFGNTLIEYGNRARFPIVVPLIENTQAIVNLEEIIKLSLFGILIGRYDLSKSFGKPGEITSKKITNAISEISKRAMKVGLPWGIHLANPNQKELRRLVKKGAKIIAYGMDSTFLWNSAKIDTLTITGRSKDL
jgi:4-hydroxy-2-oxoheptanedioate aldolase